VLALSTLAVPKPPVVAAVLITTFISPPLGAFSALFLPSLGLPVYTENGALL
jgi:hypothetical protein